MLSRQALWGCNDVTEPLLTVNYALLAGIIRHSMLVNRPRILEHLTSAARIWDLLAQSQLPGAELCWQRNAIGDRRSVEP